MFVGEQPGDREDREGHPVCRAGGRLLDEALVDDLKVVSSLLQA